LLALALPLDLGCGRGAQHSSNDFGDIPLDCPNALKIRSGAGETVFSMEGTGKLWYRQNWKPGTDKVVINLEGDERVSGGNEYLHPPSIILSWLDSPFDLNRLLTRSVHIPHSYSKEQQDHVTDFYYGEHLDFDDVRIDIVERKGNRFRIRVTGKTIDIESSRPGVMTIEIDTCVEFVDRNSPRVTEPSRTVDGIGEFFDTEGRWECTAEYAGHPIRIRLSSEGDAFDEFAKYAGAVMRQERVSLETMRNDIKDGLPGLAWKLDHFNVTPDFDIGGFVPDTFTITEGDKKSDDFRLYVFLTHPNSGTDSWILRYSNSECYSLEWIPDR
jgi:hypothetical protein